MQASENVPAHDSLRQLTEILSALKRAFIGKDEIIDLLGVCLVGGENLFLLGPPGTAKTAIVHELGRCLNGRVFDYLLTRFTEPNELFGPFDIRKLREGELITNTEGMLPEADLVFLDELLNANSAILNSLLMVLNERIFRRGRESRELPVMMVVAASNRLPDDDALAALFDRFLVRVRSDQVPNERLGEVLAAGWTLERDVAIATEKMTVADVQTLRRQINSVDLSDVRPVYVELVRRLRQAGIPVSDRRAVKLQRLVAASAVLCGRQRAMVTDLWVIRYTWDTEEQHEMIAAIVQELIDVKDETIVRQSHPRSRRLEGPDPEELARDLEKLVTYVNAHTGANNQDQVRDQLTLLAGRCQWVRDNQQREFLEQRVQSLWTQLNQTTG
jgi:MoxR-like ATPase